MRLPHLVLLAQTPPPVYGQSVMHRYLAEAHWPWCRKEHLPLRFSNRIEEVGHPTPAKVVRLLGVALAVWRNRLRGPLDVLYYPPAGPHRVPVLRDIVLLALIRPAFRRVVFHFHAGGFDRVPRMLGPFTRGLAGFAYRRPDCAIVLDQGLAGEVAWIRPRNVRVVPNGVPDQRVSRIPSGKGDLLYVGSLTREKGIPDLLSVVHRLLASGTGCTLHLVGAFRTQGFETELERMIARLGIGGSVRLHGELQGNAKWEAFATADLFCYASRETEAMPVAILEALSCGVPVVTLRSRALPSIVGAGGECVPPGDPEAFAGTVARLLREPAQRAALGAAARKEYEAHYTLRSHLAGLESAVRETLGC